jgi:hypothetical protein
LVLESEEQILSLSSSRHEDLVVMIEGSCPGVLGSSLHKAFENNENYQRETESVSFMILKGNYQPGLCRV